MSLPSRPAAPADGTVFEEQVTVVANASHPGGQFLLRLHAPQIAAAALPGQFIHLRCDRLLPLRRPFSLMWADSSEGRIDLLVKEVGRGTRALRRQPEGARLPALGPIGRPFDLSDRSRAYLCIGGGVGIPPMIFAALRAPDPGRVLLLAGSEVPFPFALVPSGFLVAGMEGDTIMAIRSLEERGIASRLASRAGFYGCFDGFVPQLAERHLLALEPSARNRCSLLACGPPAMLRAVAALGRRFGLPTQLSLEEYMACGIGGCAGCVVRTVEQGVARYRRVCVDGPVFDAALLPEL
ncbi:MAG: dihydroorotate dehydrogenase electron transfer subunit [Zetaproteobacteria bacterium]|nr:MAG: dihydroorotate dehydrogenase electron transfer subunit [Zetaproteobacteria bacterium]